MAHLMLNLSRGGKRDRVLLPPPGETVLKSDAEPLLLIGFSEEHRSGRIGGVRLAPEGAAAYCDFSALQGLEIRPNESFRADDIRLINPAAAPLAARLSCQLELDVFFDDAQPKLCIISFELHPFPEWSGIFAIDFGNSGTTCVVLPFSVRQNLFEDPNFRCLDLDQAGGDVEKTQVTAIRFLDFDADRLTRWEVGNKVREAFQQLMAEGTVEAVKRSQGYHTGGIKRRLGKGKGADEDAVAVVSTDKDRSIDERGPELSGNDLVGYTLRGFVRKAEQSRLPAADGPVGRFADLVVATHPVNYTPAQIDAMRGLYHDFLGLDPTRVELRYDEATAAAIYYLTRHLRGELIHEFWAATDDPLLPPPEPGRPELHRFNMLVFDCGGGTTDIALLAVELERRTEANPSGAKTANWFEVRPAVLGLTGLEDFAGDNMTLEAMLFLRFRLADALVRTGQEIDVLSQAFWDAQRGQGATDATDQRTFWSSGDAQNFKTYLKELAKMVTERKEGQTDLEFYREVSELCRYIVPTDFGRAGKDHGPASVEYRLRRNLFNYLWKAAEELKIGLSGSGVSAFPANVPQELLRHFHTPDGNELLASVPELSTIEVRRDELDALLRDRVGEAWDLAADLCQELKDGQKLHEVVLAGNGSQYPLVRGLLRDRFAPAAAEWFTYQERRVRFDVKDAKFACAKGAAIALWYTKQLVATVNHPDQTVVDFRPVSTSRMPFSLFLQDPNGGPLMELFVRGEPIPEEPGFIEKVIQYQARFSVKRGLKKKGSDQDVMNYSEFAVDGEPGLAAMPEGATRKVFLRVDRAFELTAWLQWSHAGVTGEVPLRRRPALSSDPHAHRRNPFEGFN